MTGSDGVEARIEQALAKLDLETKVSLLSGQDMWTLPAIPDVGLASLVMSDGPVGVRGTGWTPGETSVTLPSPTALAATWDPELARIAGRVLGQESRRRGVHILLAPTVNLHRSPLGGRHFECYSEDPLLTGEIGAGYVTGVQDQGVGTTVKHFVANDSETDRMTVDVRVGERTLRELYLAPFDRIVGAGAWGVMSAYNQVNGTTMTEHGPLQNDLLKHGWGFDGVIVSDWTAARSTVPAALGGLDVVMPALGDPWGVALVAAVRSGKVPEEVVDDKVRRVLRLAARVGALDGVDAAVVDRPADLDGAAVAHEIAVRSFVLARNSGDLLPFDPARLNRVAVIGALARDARVQGGGSAQVEPERAISPLDGLTAALPDGVTVSYAIGADPRPRLPAASGPDWGPGFTLVLRGSDGGELYRAPLESGGVRWLGSPPAGVDPADLGSIELVGTLVPAVSGTHQVAINGSGVFRLSVSGETVFDGPQFREGADPATVFLDPAEQRFPVDLTAGEPVEIVLGQQIADPALAAFVVFSLGHAEPERDPDELIEEAVRLAAVSDVAVVVVGTTEEVESEGFDRTSLALPGRQDELVSRVATANPRTVVAVNSGSPVLLPWSDEVAAIVLTWFPGQEAGAALADVLLGAAEPGGRLPTTWPRRQQDCPVLTVTPTDGALAYDEGVFIGYRGWQRSGAQPLFPFGHGLGYTTWEYESVTVEPGDDLGTAVVTVRNTGTRPGREVVQVYVAPDQPDPERPARWLAGFAAAQAEPGETATVRVPLPLRSVQRWNGAWDTVPGRYTVEAGRSVADPRVSSAFDA